MVTIYKIETDDTVRALTLKDSNIWEGDIMFKLQRVRPNWNAPTLYVYDPVRTNETDFYHVRNGFLAFKKRVYDSDLAEELERCGEMLPAIREDTREEFYILNPLVCYNCLNRDKTKLRTTPDGKVVIQIYNYAFYPERIGGEAFSRFQRTIATHFMPAVV